MTKEERKKCHAIIHSASTAAAAAGGGLAQVPGSDSAIIVPAQIAMIISLGLVFDMRFDKSAAMGLLGSKMSTVIGLKVSKGLFRWFPGIGNIVNASTAFIITETLGWSLSKDFAKAKNDGFDDIPYINYEDF